MFWTFKETRVRLWADIVYFWRRKEVIFWNIIPHEHKYEYRSMPGEEHHGKDYTRRWCERCNYEQWLDLDATGKERWRENPLVSLHKLTIMHMPWKYRLRQLWERIKQL